MNAPEKSSDQGTILLAEDDVQLRELMEMILRKFRLLTCSDGLAALDLFEQHPSDIRLIIADFNLPGINAAGLIGRLKNKGHTLPPVLIISGDGARYRLAGRRERCAFPAKALLRFRSAGRGERSDGRPGCLAPARFRARHEQSVPQRGNRMKASRFHRSRSSMHLLRRAASWRKRMASSRSANSRVQVSPLRLSRHRSPLSRRKANSPFFFTPPLFGETKRCMGSEGCSVAPTLATPLRKMSDISELPVILAPEWAAAQNQSARGRSGRSFSPSNHCHTTLNPPRCGLRKSAAGAVAIWGASFVHRIKAKPPCAGRSAEKAMRIGASR